MVFTFHKSYIILELCVQYSDLLDRAQLLTQKLLKQGYVAPRLKSSLQNIYGRYHLRNVHISNVNGSFTFTLLSLPRFLPDLTA